MQLLLLWVCTRVHNYVLLVCIIITHANLETAKMHLSDYNESVRLNKRVISQNIYKRIIIHARLSYQQFYWPKVHITVC